MSDERAPDDIIGLVIAFPVEWRLSPRGVRRRFIEMLRISIAQARNARKIDPAVCEELWRALPPLEHA